VIYIWKLSRGIITC